MLCYAMPGKLDALDQTQQESTIKIQVRKLALLSKKKIQISQKGYFTIGNINDSIVKVILLIFWKKKLNKPPVEKLYNKELKKLKC